MREIISATMKKIADEPLFIVQPRPKEACYIYQLRTLRYLPRLQADTNIIKINCKDSLKQINTRNMNDLPCEPLIITEQFLQEHIFPFQSGYLGYNSSFYSGLTRGEFVDEMDFLKKTTNLTFCVNQSKS